MIGPLDAVGAPSPAFRVVQISLNLVDDVVQFGLQERQVVLVSEMLPEPVTWRVVAHVGVSVGAMRIVGGVGMFMPVGFQRCRT